MNRLNIITTVPYDTNILVIIFVVDPLLHIILYPSTVRVLYYYT